MHERTPNNHHQAIHKRWQERIHGTEPTLQNRIRKLTEEVREVEEATPPEGKNPSKEEIRHLAEELTDVIITALGALSTTGYDFESLFYEKMTKIYGKYNPALIEHYQGQGMSRDEAIEATKALWNQNGGKHA